MEKGTYYKIENPKDFYDFLKLNKNGFAFNAYTNILNSTIFPNIKVGKVVEGIYLLVPEPENETQKENKARLEKYIKSKS